MITLRHLVESHREIAAVTGDELRLVARLLSAAGDSWLLRRLLPKDMRDKAFAFRMLAATFSKAPPERAGSFEKQVRVLMRSGTAKALIPKTEWTKAEIDGAGRVVPLIKDVQEDCSD